MVVGEESQASVARAREEDRAVVWSTAVEGQGCGSVSQNVTVFTKDRAERVGGLIMYSGIAHAVLAAARRSALRLLGANVSERPLVSGAE